MDTASVYGLAGSHRVVLLVFSVLLLGLVLELVRRGLLKNGTRFFGSGPHVLGWQSASSLGLFSLCRVSFTFSG